MFGVTRLVWINNWQVYSDEEGKVYLIYTKQSEGSLFAYSIKWHNWKPWKSPKELFNNLLFSFPISHNYLESTLQSSISTGFDLPYSPHIISFLHHIFHLLLSLPLYLSSCTNPFVNVFSKKCYSETVECIYRRSRTSFPFRRAQQLGLYNIRVEAGSQHHMVSRRTGHRIRNKKDKSVYFSYVIVKNRI